MNKMAEQINDLDSLISSLNEIQADATVPRNVRAKVEIIISTLNEDAELSTKINKALNELDELSSDSNLQAYTRTQIWNIISALEKLIA